jgi:DNA-binding response OmpR family regulator
VTSVLRRGLSYEGYTVATATDGSAGLAAARETPPDLVVLDVMMPVVDGLEVLRRLRAADTSLPVLMLTGRDAPADQVQGLETGAGDYMVKPFSFEVLLAHIHALLRRREAEQPHSHLRAARPGPNRPPPRAHHPLARRRQRLCHQCRGRHRQRHRHGDL